MKVHFRLARLPEDMTLDELAKLHADLQYVQGQEALKDTQRLAKYLAAKTHQG